MNCLDNCFRPNVFHRPVAQTQQAFSRIADFYLHAWAIAQNLANMGEDVQKNLQVGCVQNIGCFPLAPQLNDIGIGIRSWKLHISIAKKASTQPPKGDF